MIGQPEKADGYLREIRNQRVLQPGEWHWYTAQVRILSGQYAEACTSLEQAVAEIRATRVARMLQGAESRLRGPFSTGSDPMLSVPVEVQGTIGDLERESQYLFTLGIIRIESGEPKQALKTFKTALKQFDRHGLRAVIEYYWKLISNDPVPEAPAPFDPTAEIAQKYNLPPMLAAPEPEPQRAAPETGVEAPGAVAPSAPVTPAPSTQPLAPPAGADAAPKK
jgi:tetratricopeptide (TPR) repeat protein